MIKMPFKIRDLPKDIRDEVMALSQYENWDGLVIFVEEYLDDITEVQAMYEPLVLCLGYAKLSAAISIHVDTVIDTSKSVINLIDSIESPSPNAARFKKQVSKIHNAARKRNREVSRLNKIPIEQLSDDEKSELAFQLGEMGGRENAEKAAELHRILFDRKEHPAQKFYRLAAYALALDRAGKYDEADQEFQKVFAWQYDRGISAYPYFITFIYYAWLDRYKKDPVMFHKVWLEALGNDVISLHDKYFPFAEPEQERLLAIAYQHKCKMFAII